MTRPLIQRLIQPRFRAVRTIGAVLLLAASAGVTALITGTIVRALDVASPSAVIPTSESQAALAVLSRPSTPQPLSDSHELADGRYRYAAGCEALRGAYQSPGAPTPPGSTITVNADGGLRVAAPFGQAAIFVRDEFDGGCTYEILSTPTLTIDAPGLPAVNDFVAVACFEPFGITFLAVIENPVPADGPHTLVIGQEATLGGSVEPDAFSVVWSPLAAAPLIAGETSPDTVEIEDLAGAYDSGTLSGSVSGSTPDGPVAIAFRCTLSNLVIPGL